MLPSWYPSPSSPQDGIFIFEQVKALQQSGLAVAVLHGSFQYRHLFKATEANFSIEAEVPTFRAKGFFPPKINTKLIEAWARQHFSLFEQYLEQFGRPDLLHAHSYLAGAVAWQLSQRYDIPYVLTEHLFRFLTEEVRLRHRKLVRKVYDGASGLIAVSTALQTKMQAYTQTKIEVIPNLVDTEIFRSLGSVQEKRESPIFVSVGHLTVTKGYDILIEAFSQFNARRSDNPVLKIIGAGTTRASLQKQIQRLGLTDSVFLLGAQDQKTVIEILQTASCFVSASRVETFGVAIIEALALGLPVIATRCGGPEEIVRPIVGQLVPIEDAKALAEAMRKVEDQNYDPKVIQNYIEARFSRAVVVNELCSFYKNVLNSSSS
ncbi:MAG: glycosyltransferase [Saprospiraceae bacterium]